MRFFLYLFFPISFFFLQGHPEFDREVVEQLAAPRLAAIGEADAQRMRQVRVGGSSAQWAGGAADDH